MSVPGQVQDGKRRGFVNLASASIQYRRNGGTHHIVRFSNTRSSFSERLLSTSFFSNQPRRA